MNDKNEELLIDVKEVGGESNCCGDSSVMGFCLACGEHSEEANEQELD